MIYSIIPHEIIMGVNQKENKQIKEIQYMGYTLEVSELDPSHIQINRIITTDLKAYLNPALQPGAIIEMELK